MPQSELLQEQICDSSLKELFGRVLSAAEIKSAASGYFLHNELLFQKWVVLDSDCVGDAVVQLVVLTKFRPVVLKVAHNASGHFGVGKMYLNILKHVFWPRVKRDVAAYIKKSCVPINGQAKPECEVCSSATDSCHKPTF